MDETLLERAQALLAKVFPPHTGAAQDLALGIGGRPYTEAESGFLVVDSRMWAAVEHDTGRVLGLVGLYSTAHDADRAVWLNWFCVDPEIRGQGLGKALLTFAIAQAKQTGRRYLRLFTEDAAFESSARRLYERFGFREVGRRPLPDEGLNRLFYELDHWAPLSDRGSGGGDGQVAEGANVAVNRQGTVSVSDSDILPNGFVRQRVDADTRGQLLALIDAVWGTEDVVWMQRQLHGEPHVWDETGEVVYPGKTWVAVDPVTGQVAATIGLFEFAKDRSEAYWVDFFAVRPEFRGQGVGKALLSFAIARARADGKRFLRLNTEDLPFEAGAQTLYEKYGFRVFRSWPDKDGGFRHLQRELALR